MINSIKKYFISNQLSKNLGMLYVLNVCDWFCTVVLLNTGYFAEANPFMSGIINNVPVGFCVKCLLPFLLFYFVNRRADYATEKQIRISVIIINFAIVIYSLIILSHILNFTLLFVLT